MSLHDCPHSIAHVLVTISAPVISCIGTIWVTLYESIRLAGLWDFEIFVDSLSALLVSPLSGLFRSVYQV